MKRRLVRSETFLIDVACQFAWYTTEAGETTALRFVESVEATIDHLEQFPEQGRPRHFAHSALGGMRSLRINAPFESIVLFYRLTPQAIELWRLLHGARDLPRHLPPSAAQ